MGTKIFRPLVCLMILTAVLPSVWAADQQSTGCHIRTYSPWPDTVTQRGYDLWETVVSDHKNFYSLNNGALFAAGVGVAAITANTRADREIRNWFQDDFRSGTSDDIAKVAKGFGEGMYVIPAYVGFAVLGELTDGTKAGSVVGEWARRCLRATLVGAPPMLLFQELLGSSRPGEGSSHWDAFNDNNGVSGHGFIGAIPFLSAAMMTDNWLFKLPLYAASTLPALSRLNDDSHYFSQAALGWWIAYLAARSIDNTELRKRHITITPAVGKDVVGIVATTQF
jgi:hypothetical protein